MGQKKAPIDLEPWQFFGWGSSRLVVFGSEQQVRLDQIKEKQLHGTHTLLNQWFATAIVGNDLLSSCLYVIGLTFASAGPLTPVCLVITASMLYLFRWVYTEAVGALPIDGGAYTILLNSTSKGVAASAACLTLLSYVATAVVSAADAIIYLQQVWPSLNQSIGVLVLLAIFCGLAILGVGESASVATCMFALHGITLILVTVCGIIFMVRDDAAIFGANWRSPFPDIVSGQEGQPDHDDIQTINVGFGVVGDAVRVIARGNVASALFFGFGQSLLGVSGFESTANMVQSMEPGAFPLVLRNLWMAVAVVNPILALVTMGVLPMHTIYQRSSDVIVAVGQAAVGGGFEKDAKSTWLAYVVAVDAFIVLSGATLTSFIGVQGLIGRMSLDKCLPEFLMQKNACRGTPHWIPITFAAISASLYLILSGDVDTLSGVYTVSFLSVMCLFAIGNGLLRYKRPSLRRPLKASRGTIACALVLALMGLLANIVMKPSAVQYFVIYFSCVGTVVLVMFFRTQVMQLMLPVVRSCAKRSAEACPSICGCCVGHRVDPSHSTPLLGYTGAIDDEEIDDAGGCLTAAIRSAREEPVVYLAKRPDLPALNKAILYIRANENTQNVVIAHFMEISESRHSAGGAADSLSASADKGSASLRRRFAADQLIPLSEQGEDSPGTIGPHDAVQLEGPAAILQEQVVVLDALYPKIRIDFLCISGTSFGPDALNWLADYVDVSINSVFIGAPDSDFAHQVAALGGVRVITKPTRDVIRQKFRVEDEAVARKGGGPGRSYQGESARVHLNLSGEVSLVETASIAATDGNAESRKTSSKDTSSTKSHSIAGSRATARNGPATSTGGDESKSTAQVSDSAANALLVGALQSASKPTSSFRRAVIFSHGGSGSGQELVDELGMHRSHSMPDSELDDALVDVSRRAGSLELPGGSVDVPAGGLRRHSRTRSYVNPATLARISIADGGPLYAGSLPLTPPALGRSQMDGGTGLVPLLLYGSSSVNESSQGLSMAVASTGENMGENTGAVAAVPQLGGAGNEDRIPDETASDAVTNQSILQVVSDGRPWAYGDQLVCVVQHLFG